MADVKIRKLEDWVVEAHRARAKANGRSLEEELRRVVSAAAAQPRAEAASILESVREEIRRRHGVLPDSGPQIRAERDR